MPALAAELFTTCQITFSVTPLPQTVPLLVTQRKTLPSVIDAAVNQPSIAVLTQSGTGTVRMWAALPTKSTAPGRSRRIGQSRAGLHRLLFSKEQHYHPIWATNRAH